MSGSNSARDELAALQGEILKKASVAVSTRRLTLRSGVELQLLECGEGEPLILVHGGGTSALQLLPLMEKIEGRRLIAVDRPGFGLSDPVDYKAGDFRETAVNVLRELLDALDLEAADVAGNSMGGVWCLWLALDAPERVKRVVLVGSAPLLPGARVPIPLRVMTLPLMGELMNKMPASPGMIRQIMGAFGEGDSILEHPDQIEALVAAGGDPIAGKAGLDETRAIANFFGFQGRRRFSPEDLGKLAKPVLMAWGERDPILPADSARDTAKMFANGELTLVPSGHLPWLAAAEQIAAAISTFLRA